MIATKLKRCRMCGNDELNKILSLGIHELSGVFPKTKEEKITSGPLELVFCSVCGLLQLGHSYSLEEMYGENYGYRSGLNRAMVEHLSAKANMLESRYNLVAGDVVLDIGSNDGTTLNSYSTKGLKRMGMDPTGRKFSHYYDKGIQLVSDFFTADLFTKTSGQEAKVVTSISMFYDLESPIHFAQQIESILAKDGIWHFEQSYMPTMLRNNAYDTVCHEHLEYYSIKVIEQILEKVGLRMIEVSSNDVNGGSFAVTAAREASSYSSNLDLIKWYLRQEDAMGLNTSVPYYDFAQKAIRHREQFVDLLDTLNQSGKLVCGYGASTKGNVILQYCGITEKQIKVIGEVNTDKFGAYTPGTLIPIEDEQVVMAMKPDYLVVFPWHFRNGILAREKEFLQNGGHFIFPLPFIEIV